MRTTPVNVRYMVEDVDAAVEWYTARLGFKLLSSAAPAFADVARGSLRLLLSGPTSSARRSLSGGLGPAPGGWNHIQLVVADLNAEGERLRAAGLKIHGLAIGRGKMQLLLQDPSGNLVELQDPSGNLFELFHPTRGS